MRARTWPTSRARRARTSATPSRPPAAAYGGWAKRTAYNRGQVLYRFAEALESRSDELARAAVAQRDVSLPDARAELGAAVDLLVHYAGWTDKLAAVMGGINPVAGPHLSFSTPEPTGVVAVLAPDEPDVLGLIREVAPVLAAGNAAVVLVSRRWPLRALDLGEVAGVSDVPGGVLNLLCGRMDELLTPLCGHRDVNAIVDATGDGVAGGHDRRARVRDGQAGVAAEPGRRPAVAPGGGHGAQDRLAPDRDLAARCVARSSRTGAVRTVPHAHDMSRTPDKPWAHRRTGQPGSAAVTWAASLSASTPGKR